MSSQQPFTRDGKSRPPLASDTGSVASELRIDWRAYFGAFSEAHGGDPVIFGGRLLFQDGWTHSLTDYAGPEWPPPADPEEKRRLIRAYWLRRKAVCEGELREAEQRLRDLTDMQKLRSAPLQQTTRVKDESTGRWATVHGRLDLSSLRGRVDWLRDDVQFCVERLEEVGNDPATER